MTRRGEPTASGFRKRNDGNMVVQDELIGKVGRWYEEHPHQKTFYVLNVAALVESYSGGIGH